MKYFIGFMAGIMVLAGISFKFPTTFTKTVSVSLLQELEDCKNQGGEFHAAEKVSEEKRSEEIKNLGGYIQLYLTTKPDEIHIECNIPEKNVMSKEFKL